MKGDSLINWKILASLEGDGGDFVVTKSASINDTEFFSEYFKGQRTLTTPDTIRIKTYKKSIIKLMPDSRIQETTRYIKYDSIHIE